MACFPASLLASLVLASIVSRHSASELLLCRSLALVYAKTTILSLSVDLCSAGRNPIIRPECAGKRKEKSH